MGHSGVMSADYPLVALQTRAELRSWLHENHDSVRGIWLVSWRRDDLGPRIDYEDLVEEVLCFGWIDSTAMTVDDDRSAIRLTPRRRGSVWSRPNKIRLERLLGTGLMTPAGLAVIERAKADGSWTFLDDVEDLVVPDDLTTALEAAGAQAQFAGLTVGRRKQLLYWIKSAKREATRNDRIARTVSAAEQGRSALE